MKRFTFIATALIALASCSENEFVGENTSQTSQTEQGAIVFGSGTSNITRADFNNEQSADLLGKNFVVEGFKWNGTTEGSDTKDEVFDHYNVNWVTNTANTTTSNTNNWEYVGQTKHSYGPTGSQTIKYWDYSKKQYDFIAYSVGKENTAVYESGSYSAGTNVYITEIDRSKMNGELSGEPATITDGAYKIKGRTDQLAKVYIADLQTIYRDGTAENDAAGGYKNVVTLTFRPLSAKVRIGLYEIIPGYSVKDVVFYSNNSTKVSPTSGTWGEAHLYTTGTDVFNTEGTYIVYFPTTGKDKAPGGANENTDYNKAHLKFTAEASGTTKDKAFGSTLVGSLSGGSAVLATAEDQEAAGNLYLGRSSNAAIYAGDKSKGYYTIVLPNETGAELNLKVDYKLVSTDGSGETIQVTGASAKVPKEFATWKSGYAYTYLFKISQDGNGVTNPSAGPVGLYPITFDAVVVNDEVDNTQETITTVATPSITTYAKGTIVTENNEYLTGNNIYVVVSNDGTTLSSSNAKLYTVTLQGSAAQTINEASVANALAHGQKDDEGSPTKWTVTDANGKKMEVSNATGLSFPGKIAAADALDGNEISINCAMFTPAEPTFTAAASPSTTEGLYEQSGSGTSDDPYVYTPTSDTTVNANKTYYTKTSTTAGTYVFEYTYTEETVVKKAYKIIKVVDKN